MVLHTLAPDLSFLALIFSFFSPPYKHFLSPYIHMHQPPGVQNHSSCPTYYTLSHWWALDWARIFSLLFWLDIIIKVIPPGNFSLMPLPTLGGGKLFIYNAPDHFCQTSCLAFSSSRNSIHWVPILPECYQCTPSSQCLSPGLAERR